MISLAPRLGGALRRAQSRLAPRSDHHLDGPPHASDRRIYWVAFAIVWVAGAIYAGMHLKRGWVSVDDGALGQTAERVLRGELPHRDFDDIYTGGLALMNAGAFRIFGIDLVVLRVVLFAWFLCWVPAVFYIATRFARPVTAALVTTLAVAWSIPAYSAALPSWYNLFCATFGVAALLHQLETGGRRWLFIAGVWGGISFLFKLAGIYYVAGILLYLAYQEQLAAHHPADTGNGPEEGRGYSLFLTGGVLAFVGLVAAVVRVRFDAMTVVHLALPAWAIAAVLLAEEWRSPARTTARLSALTWLTVPFVAGVLLPVALFLVPYVVTGGLSAWVHGVFVAPGKRLTYAAMAFPGYQSLGAFVPVLLLLGLGRAALRPQRWGPLQWVAVAAAIAASIWIVELTADVRWLYRYVWYAMRSLLPVVAVGTALTLTGMRNLPSHTRARLFLVSAVASVCSLIQFPYSAAVYYLYVSPLAALAVLALLGVRGGARRAGPIFLLSLFVAFAGVRIHRSYFNKIGAWYAPDANSATLAVPRGGIRIPPVQAEGYARIASLVRAHARGDFAFVTPDAPEIYFLAAKRNPTRTIFDFFDDPVGRTNRVLGLLEARVVNVVVINTLPLFSPAIDMRLATEFVRRYPNHESVGSFIVMWRP